MAVGVISDRGPRSSDLGDRAAGRFLFPGPSVVPGGDGSGVSDDRDDRRPGAYSGRPRRSGRFEHDRVGGQTPAMILAPARPPRGRSELATGSYPRETPATLFGGAACAPN